MKIGFSFGRCLRDIVNGTVDYKEVFLIYSRTAIYDSSNLDYVVDEYSLRPEYLQGLDRDECLAAGTRLITDCKLIQPRIIYGRNPPHVFADCVWMDLAPTLQGEDANSEQVIAAWKNYQMALKLSSTKSLPTPHHLDNF